MLLVSIAIVFYVLGRVHEYELTKKPINKNLYEKDKRKKQ